MLALEFTKLSSDRDLYYCRYIRVYSAEPDESKLLRKTRKSDCVENPNPNRRVVVVSQMVEKTAEKWESSLFLSRISFSFLHGWRKKPGRNLKANNWILQNSHVKYLPISCFTKNPIFRVLTTTFVAIISSNTQWRRIYIWWFSVNFPLWFSRIEAKVGSSKAFEFEWSVIQLSTYYIGV